jgi:K319-like protein/PKD domain-containing protein
MRINSLAVTPLLVFWLIACGGKNSPEAPSSQNTAPIAHAGGDRTVTEGSSVTLDANLSSDNDGTIVGYLWTQISGLSDIVINNANQATATIVAPQVDLESSFIFQVTVTDDDGATDSNSVIITVVPATQTNQSPMAVVPDAFSQSENTEVILDGSASHDPDGTIINYSWIQTAGLPRVTLNNSDTAAADFTAPSIDTDTSLSFELTVTDDQGDSDSSTVTATITDTTMTNQITAVIETSRTTCTAPCGIMFNASTTSSTGVGEPFHQLHYSWSYGDPGATFQQRLGVNANQSSTVIGAHVYEHPGTYTATLTVTGDDGGTDTQTVTIIVEDPEIVFANATYCVSNTNRFSSCPTQDPKFHLASFVAASTFLSNLRFNQAGQPTRVLFRSGDTFIATNQFSIRETSAALQIASFGSGVDPIISLDSLMNDETLFFVHDVSDITFNNITFSGNYNPVTGLGNHAMAIWFYLAVSDSLVYQNQFSGIDIAIYPHGGSNLTTGAPSQYQMIVDNDISNWQDYGIFGTFGYLSTLLANNIKQDPNAISGSEGKCSTCIPNFPDHGPLRAGYSNHLLIQHNDMFNNAGWSSAGLAHQPNIRLGTGGTSRKSIVADNFLEGGFTTISMTPANPGSASAAAIADVIIERNQLIASSNTWQTIDMGIGGSTIRNNLFLKPDNAGPPIGTGSFETPIVFKVADDRTTPGSLALTNRIYNNTLISLALSSASNIAMVEVENNFTQFEIYNNIAYIPFASGNAEAGILSWRYAGSLNNVSMDNNLLFAPNTTNYVWENGMSKDLTSWQGSGNDMNSLLIDPQLTAPINYDAHLNSNSPAINAGKPILGLQNDKDKKIRDTNVDIGAYEF